MAMFALCRRLSYEDIIPDGFYDCYGDFPEVGNSCHQQVAAGMKVLIKGQLPAS